MRERTCFSPFLFSCDFCRKRRSAMQEEFCGSYKIDCWSIFLLTSSAYCAIMIKTDRQSKKESLMKKGEKRKQELLLTAYKMFLTKGYDGASVDDIIEEAQIAKGTFYYYFESKEQILEEVIEMMIAGEAEKAGMILSQPIPAQQKIVGIIVSMRPDSSEAPIESELERPENIIMHNKIRKKLMQTIVPLLTQAVEQGINEGIFHCDNIPERVKILLNISTDLFDEESFTPNDTAVYIDTAEKLLGAEKGTMEFIRSLIR